MYYPYCLSIETHNIICRIHVLPMFSIHYIVSVQCMYIPIPPLLPPLPSFPPSLHPFPALPSLPSLPPSPPSPTQEKIQSTIETISLISSKPRPVLQLLKKKPKSIKFYEPSFDEMYHKPDLYMRVSLCCVCVCV